MKMRFKSLIVVLFLLCAILVPIDGIADPVDLILDNGDAQFTGTWTSTSFAICYGTNAMHDININKGTKTALYTPSLKKASRYYVFMWWSKADNRATNVPVDVNGYVKNTVTVNQKANGNEWYLLGCFDLPADSRTSVKINTTGTDGYVIADAVRFVEAGTSVYIATNGDDNGRGDISSPLATLERARQFSRSYYKYGGAGDFYIYLRGGIYERKSVFTVSDEDNPVNGKLHILSCPGETAVLRGAKKLDGWQLWQDGIYRTYIDDVKKGIWDFDNLYEDGRHSVKARYPNTGWLSAVAMPAFSVTPAPSPAPSPNRNNFRFNTGDIPNWSNITGAQVYIFPMFRWSCNVVPIDSINYTNNQITLLLPIMSMRTNIANGDNYYIQGVLEALDTEGEFYLDKPNGLLYYKPYSSSIQTAEICAPVLDRIMELKGTSPQNQVKNVVIENLTFEMTKFTNYYSVADFGNYLYPSVSSCQGLIYTENAAGNIVQKCKMRLAGFNGIFSYLYSNDNTFVGNEIYDNGNSGIYLAGTLNGTLDTVGNQIYDNKSNVISNNYIHDCGKIVLNGGGVLLYQSGENEISHNVINNMPRYGIFLQTMAGNNYDFTTGKTDRTTYKNKIMYNDVSQVNLDTDDVGAINVWNGVETTIDTNRVHEVGKNNFVHAIYLDDVTVKSSVKNNIVYNVMGNNASSVLTQRSYQNMFENNIFIASPGMGYVMRNLQSWLNPNKEHSYIGNIFCASSEGTSVYDINSYSSQAVTNSDFNTFWDTSGKYKVTSIPGVPNMNSWFMFENGRYDNSSLISDPMLENITQGELSLSASSPAYKLGFSDIDVASIGTTSSFNYAPTEPLSRLYFRSGLKYSSVNIRLGQTIETQVSGRTASGFFVPVQDSSVNYRSNNINTATVDQNGLITGMSKGIAVISATATINGVVKNDTITVYVDDILQSVKLDYKYHGVLAQGDTRRPTFTTVSSLGVERVMRTPAQAGVTFSSSNPNVVKVDTDGVITCVSSGNAIITAVYGGFSANVSIETSDIFREDFEPHLVGTLQQDLRGWRGNQSVEGAVRVEEEQGNKFISVNSVSSLGLFKKVLTLPSPFIMQGKFKVERDGTRLMSLIHDDTHLTHTILFDNGKIYIKNSTSTFGLFTYSEGDICLGAYQSGRWYDIKCVIYSDGNDQTPDTWDLYIDGRLVKSSLKLPPLNTAINSVRVIAITDRACCDDFAISGFKDLFVFIDKLNKNVVITNYSKEQLNYDIYNVGYTGNIMNSVSKTAAVILPGQNIFNMNIQPNSSEVAVFVWKPNAQPLVASYKWKETN